MAQPDDDQAATKGDLRKLEGRLRGDMKTMEGRILMELGRAVNTVVEQIGANARVVDEKYKDLPGRVAAVERKLEEHAEDTRLHKRPPPSAPRRGAKGR